MTHRTYRGKVLYLTDGVGERGRETFHVTIQPDGTRTMRATCEMDDDRLLRDVVVTVDREWRPQDAFIRLSIEEKLVGSSWFRFTAGVAECQGFTATHGRISQVFDTDGPTRSFGTHPVHNDAWALARLKTRTPGMLEDNVGPGFSSSHLPNGGSGPVLLPSGGRSRKRYVGRETLTVTAGTYEVEHFQILFGTNPPLDIWATPKDCVPVRLRWDLLKQTYELVELTGDAQ